MRKIQAADFSNAFEFEQAKKQQRKQSKQGRQARSNGRGRLFSPCLES